MTAQFTIIHTPLTLLDRDRSDHELRHPERVDLRQQIESLLRGKETRVAATKPAKSQPAR
jgi:hypothetical protein